MAMGTATTMVKVMVIVYHAVRRTENAMET